MKRGTGDLALKITAEVFCLLLISSLFVVGGYAQEETDETTADITEPEISEEDGGSLFNCAVAMCFEGYNCVQGVGCVLGEKNNFGNCGDEEWYDHVSQTCRSRDFNYKDNYESKGFVGGFFNKLKIAFANEEDKIRLTVVVGAEHIADFERAVAEGDKKAMLKSAESIRQVLADSGNYLEEYAGSVDYDYGFVPGDRNSPYNKYTEMHWSEMQNVNKFNEIKEVLLKKVARGEISEEITDEAIAEVERSISELVFALEDTQEEIMDKTVENSDGEFTELEIEYYSRAVDDEAGVERRFYLDAVSADEIADSSLRLDILKQEITESDDISFGDMDNLYLEAQIEFQEARDGLAKGNYQDAYFHYETADYLVNSIGDYVKDGESALDDVYESVDRTFEEITFEIEDKNRQIVEDYETEGVRESIVESYPKYQVDVDKDYTEATGIVVVIDDVAGIADAEVEKLKYQGESEESAVSEVEEMKAQELAYATGVRYSPPGYVIFSDVDGDGVEEPAYGGGYMNSVNYPVYSDEAKSYVFGTNGYSWESPFGNTYVSNHPADYNPERYQRGNENFEYTYETEDGTFNVEFVGCGVIFNNPDGTEEKTFYADIAPTMTTVGGTEFRYSPAGYDVIYDGKATRWVENPAFTNKEGEAVYMDIASGLIYTPEIGHHEPAVYDPETDTYNYNVGSTEVAFDSDTNIFTLAGTTEIAPPVPTVPIGVESEEGEVVLQNGDVWTYNNEGVWEYTRTNDDGEMETGTITEAPNNLYGTTDEGEIINVDGEVVEQAEFLGESWVETPRGLWVSENSGFVYNPINGETIDSEGRIVSVDGADVDSGGRIYGRVYDSDGNEVRRSTFRTDLHYVFDPSRGRNGNYVFVPRSGIFGYDPANPTTYEQPLPDGTTRTWTMDENGRYYVAGTSGERNYYGYQNYYREEEFAKVGTRVIVDEREYYVDGEKGWMTTDADGNAYPVGPPRGYPTSETHARRGFYGAYDTYYHSGNEARNYNYAENGKVYYFPPNVNPASLTSEEKEGYKVESAYGYYGYDRAFGAAHNYVSAVPDPVGVVRYGSDGKTYTKKESGDWESEDGVTVGTYPGLQRPSTEGFYASDAYTGDYGRGYGTYYSGPGSYYSSGFGSYSSGAVVGTTVVGDDGRTYIVTEEGWSVDGTQVSPPTVGGVQQPSYSGYSGGYGCANGACGYSGGYYGSSGSQGSWVSDSSNPNGGYYVGGSPSGGSYGTTYGAYAPDGSYSPGGYYTSSSDGTTFTYTAPDGTTTTGSYSDYSGYYGGGSYDSGESWGYDSYSGTYYAGEYTGGWGSYDSSGVYVGPDYGGYDSSGAYVGGTTYTQNADGTWSSTDGSTGTTSGGESTGTTSSSSGGDSGGTTSGSTSSGGESSSSSSGGESSSSSSGGAVIAGEDAKINNWLIRVFKKIFGFD